MTAYQKYLVILNNGCSILYKTLPAIGQAPLTKTKEEINARIELVETAIKSLQNVKRALIYFKNKVDG